MVCFWAWCGGGWIPPLLYLPNSLVFCIQLYTSFIRSLTAGYAAGRGVGLGGAILRGAGAARTLRRRGCSCGVSGGEGGGGGAGRWGGGWSLAISRIVPGGLPS